MAPALLAAAKGDLTTAYNDAAGITAEFTRNLQFVLLRQFHKKQGIIGFVHMAFDRFGAGGHLSKSQIGG